VPDRIADLEARLAAVERRLNVLEGAGAAAAAVGEPEAGEPTLDDGLAAVASAHMGRVLLIFGGAYLLRAITDFGLVPTAVGLLMGATYALFWLFMAFRKAGQDRQRTTAAFYGGTSVVLAQPLLLEAITKFELLSGRQGVAALAIYCALAYLVSASRALKTLAWLATAVGIAVATGMLIASQAAIAVAVFLMLLGLGSLWTVYGRHWMGLQWLGAVGANAGVMMLVALSNTEQWAIEPRTAFVFGIVLLLAYLCSFAIHTHRRARHVNVFEVIQTIFAGIVAFWGVANAILAGQLGAGKAGLLCIALGAAAYALALTKTTREVRSQNFFYYESLGLVLVIAGSGLLLPLAWASMFWALLAAVTAWFSGRTGWVNLSLQCTFLVLAAGIGSGLLATGFQAFVGDPGDGWPVFAPAHVLIALATVACLFIPVAQRSERWGTGAGVPQVIVLALSVWEVGGLFVVLAAAPLAGAGGPEPDASVLAALRTAVLAVSSVTLALSSRYPRWPEARWLVYPVLVLVIIKLSIEDFPNGQAATLFVALAFVGSALLLVAKLLRRPEGPLEA